MLKADEKLLLTLLRFLNFSNTFDYFLKLFYDNELLLVIY